MQEWIDHKPDIDIPDTEYKRLLGYPPDYPLEGRAGELTAMVKQWYAQHGNPWIYARYAEDLVIDSHTFQVDGIEFSSTRLLEQLKDAEAHNAVVVAVSAGKNLEKRAQQLWKEEKPDEYFFMEMYGSAVVEHLVTRASAHICAWADQRQLAVLPHYSPGYPEWNILEQGRLMDLIRSKQKTGFPEQIDVMETGMLNPKKSLLAVFGVTRHTHKVKNHLIPCENCSLEGCQFRRAPYWRTFEQIENVEQLQNANAEKGEEKKSKTGVLNREASYSISQKALRKWSAERLKINVMDDRSIEAYFRYEGTTCSNMGRPLQFDYLVKLSPSQDLYRIKELNCVPAPGDDGYRYMCQYLKNADALMASIENEKPLLGQPLDTILDWEHQVNPSACYCASTSREHKWSLVYQVIHYALVQREKEEEDSGKKEEILR